MARSHLAVLALALLLVVPAPVVAQRAASSSRASPAAPAVAADTGSISPREPPDRTSRFVIGTTLGALVGAGGGSIYGNQNYEPCTVDCFWDRGHEVLLFAILGGIGGSVIGGLAGWFWPDRPAQSVGVGLAPTRHDGVAVSVSVRH